MLKAQTRMRSRRFLLVGAVGGIIVLAGAAIAAASYPTNSVTVMTACLTTSGTGAGNIVNVAASPSVPSKSCGSNQMLIHLSGGTITQVTGGAGLTTAGSGGTDINGSPNSINNGFATLGLEPGYQLPQSGCASGQFVASDGSGGWSCKDQKTYGGGDFALSNQSCDTGQFLTGFDASGGKRCAADQTYANGSGLDLTGNTFSVSSSYQLPQGCNNGQVAASDGSNGWTCKSNPGTPEGVSDLTDYTYARSISLGDDDSGTVDVFCNSGDIATGGGWSVSDDASIIEAGPVNSNGYEGWSAKGSTSVLEYGGVTVYVKCLTTLH